MDRVWPSFAVLLIAILHFFIDYDEFFPGYNMNMVVSMFIVAMGSVCVISSLIDIIRSRKKGEDNQP